MSATLVKSSMQFSPLW